MYSPREGSSVAVSLRRPRSWVFSAERDQVEPRVAHKRRRGAEDLRSIPRLVCRARLRLPSRRSLVRVVSGDRSTAPRVFAGVSCTVVRSSVRTRFEARQAGALHARSSRRSLSSFPIHGHGKLTDSRRAGIFVFR